jgi:hypothetical protein
MREHEFNRIGEYMLELGLQALGRSRECRAVIDRDGPMVKNRTGLPRHHPLCNIEIQERKFAASIFKRLRIHLRKGLNEGFL